MMTDLVQRSQELILQHQAPSGGYVASPAFENYAYCWYRDGAFIAYAMDLYGHHESSARFHKWAAEAIVHRSERVDRAVAKATTGKELSEDDILHTRYELDGREGNDEWPNFQLDGFGAWLWALSEHARLTGRNLEASLLEGADLAARYLRALWSRPCYDCWEEFPERVHSYTLGAIHGGLRSYGELRQQRETKTLGRIRTYLDRNLTSDGSLVKFRGSTEVDASLLGLATPFRVVEPSDPLMRTTVDRLEVELTEAGGVHRYRDDSYYGGGQWVLLGAWLGWHYAQRGDDEAARKQLEWVESQADAEGQLPEQIPVNLNQPDKCQHWRDRWGDIARPLLWSHAKHLILAHALQS